MHETKNREWKKSGAGNTLKDVIETLSGYSIAQLKSNPVHEISGMEELALEFTGLAGTEKTVFTIGDYDVDGITSSIILSLIYEEMDIPYRVYIPKRMTDGYGVNENIMKKAIKCDVVVTVDNGIAAREVLNAAKADGKAVYVIDHHEAPEDGLLPDADILVDPEAIPDESDTFTHYCAAGLCYKLAQKLYEMKQIQKKTMAKITILAMLGTVADVMPLVNENRTIVRNGLKLLNSGGWKQLSQELNLSDHTTAKDIAFKVAPVINAGGRLYNDGGQKVYRILKGSIQTGTGAVNMLVDINEERKALQKEIYKQVKAEYLEHLEMYPVIMKTDCPQGLLGIMAGRLAEETRKPTFIFTETEKGLLKGSARGSGDFHVKSWMDAHKEYFTAYGGHAGAAGMSMEEEGFAKLQEICLEEGKKHEQMENPLLYDLEVTEKDLPRILSILDSLEPFGEGCPRPVLKLKIELVCKSGPFYKRIGGDSIRMNGNGFSAVGFGLYEKYKCMKHPLVIEAVGTVNNNCYEDKKYMQFELADFKPVVSKKEPENQLLKMIQEKARERSAASL